MLVTFVGSPASGKTTVAATIFAELKKTGMPVEFVAERARLYIAKLKQQSPRNQHPIILGDMDQLQIMEMQMADEMTMHLSNPKGIVVSDSSALNSLFYMTKNCREELLNDPHAIQRFNELYNPATTLCYYCEPTMMMNTLDPNRVHSLEESLKVDELIRSYQPGKELMLDKRPSIFPWIKRLVGSSGMRSNEVLREVYEGYAVA